MVLSILSFLSIRRIDESLGLAGSLNDQLDASRDAIGILRDLDSVCAATEEEVCFALVDSLLLSFVTWRMISVVEISL